MIFSPSIRSWFAHRIEWVKANFLLTILCSLLVGMLVAFVAVMASKNLCWISPYLGLTEKNKILTFLGIGMGGILLALQAVIANKRAQAMEDAANAQAEANQNAERGQRQERLKNAIEHLGHDDSDSVRLGGAYELFHLAQDTPDLRQTVLDILCAHIRQTTGDNEYRGKCKSKPSEEIQSLLTLLFVQKYKVFKGCHINLQGSWLNGARLERARLRGATLDEIYLQGAFLTEAHLQGASLIQAQLGGAFLPSAYLQGTILLNTHLEQAKLAKAGLQGAFFHETYLQSANLHGAQMQGVTASEGLIIRELLNEWMSMGFTERIRTLIHQESDVSGAFFSGGLIQEDVDAIRKNLPHPQAEKFQRELKPHIGGHLSHLLPNNSGAVTGFYREKEAEQWIAEYEDAMSAVPKADNGQ